MFVLNKIALQLEQRSNLKCHFQAANLIQVGRFAFNPKMSLLIDRVHKMHKVWFFKVIGLTNATVRGCRLHFWQQLSPIPTNPDFQATVLLQGPVIVVVCCCLLLFGLCSKIYRHDPHLHRQDISGPALITSPHVTKARCFLPCGNSHGRQWRAIHMFRKISPK